MQERDCGHICPEWCFSQWCFSLSEKATYGLVSTNRPLPKAEDLPLMSFVDMIFGGQLTSILVCQKCKHVSQTYEDFNDISLSLKPEDYANRKRDRFRKIVGRLTNFPSSTFNNLQGKEKPTQSTSTTIPPTMPANTVEMLRSSSVPPTPSEEKQRSFPGGGLEDPPIEASRRRSLDLSVESLLQDGAGVANLAAYGRWTLSGQFRK
jgi:hypothetical protein